jgi:hypothetical protein
MSVAILHVAVVMVGSKITSLEWGPFYRYVYSDPAHNNDDSRRQLTRRKRTIYY